MGDYNYQEDLERFAKTHKFFIDTCTLMEPSSKVFFEDMKPFILKYDNPIIVPMFVVREIENNQKKKDKPDTAQKADQAYKLLYNLQKEGLVIFRGESNDVNHADAMFLSLFDKYRYDYRLILLTQDHGLATDILKKNESESARGNKIKVRRLTQKGWISKFYFDKKPVKGENDKKPYKPGKPAPPANSFKVYTQVTSIKDEAEPLVKVPGEGDDVFVQNQPIRLEKELASGGEGSIYLTNTSYVAKIYKKDKNTGRRREKIERMLAHQLKYPGICLPEALLTDRNGSFVGYMMPAANGVELQKSVFLQPLLKKNFPGWKKEDLVKLSITILEKIDYLHQHNVILGDINPANILIEKSDKVFFVDTDSYQIEDLPCPVGTINFTAPEIQRKTFSEFLRTMGNENFAVATLLFMIMMPGKPPFALTGGADQIENILNMDFAYPFGLNTNKKTPDGPWRFMWSHLPYKIKEAFYETFRKEGKFSTEKKRLSTQVWLYYFREYYNLLADGKLQANDSMANEIYPTRFKKNPNATYAKCRLCGQEFEEVRLQNGICYNCLHYAGEIFTCQKCGKEIRFSNYDKYIKHRKDPRYCRECNQKVREEYNTRKARQEEEYRAREERKEWEKGIAYTRVCIDCGNTFTITNREAKFYRDRQFDLPKRCSVCRENKKKNQNRQFDYQSKNTQPQSRPIPKKPTPKKPEPKKPEPKQKSGCFITTVVVDYMGYEDNCEVMTKLRGYRDQWLAVSPGGIELIREYYETAPTLVEKLKKSVYYAEICRELWDTYLLPCVGMINDNQLTQCRDHYIKMVHTLEQRLRITEKEEQNEQRI